MFCRFGLVLESRPVAAVVWLKVVWMRPVAGSIRSGQRVEIGVLELGQLAPGLDLLDDRVLVADLGEHPGVGREAGLAAALAGEAEILEEDGADLLRRADRELLPGQLVDLLFERVDPLAEPGADLGEPLGVELQPLALHRRQHLDQRQLDLAQQRPQAELLEAGALEVGEGRDQARLLGGLEARLDLLAERELAIVLLAFSGRAPSASPIPASAASSTSS